MNTIEQTSERPPPFEDRWADAIRGLEWTPRHPEWNVRLLRKGEPRRLGDFMIDPTGCNDVLYSIRPDEMSGPVGRYEYRDALRGEIPQEQILDFAQSQKESKREKTREIQHKDRLTLIDLAARYREQAKGSDCRKRILIEIIRMIDSSDFGCLVSFDPDSGEVEFSEADEE